MKQKFRRFMAGFLALLTVFTTLFSNGTAAFAASPSANIVFWNASVKRVGEVSELKAGYDNGKIVYAMLDGNTAYCMNYGLVADEGQLMNSFENPSTSMTPSQEKLLAYCLYFGYGSSTVAAPSDDQRDQYIATQAMVWVIVGNHFESGLDDVAASKLCASAPNPENSYNYYIALKNNIRASYYATRPSFASATKSGASTYELKWNENNQRFEITLNDTNGVLQNFDISLSGYSVERNGNNVTIYTTSVSTALEMAELKSTAGAVETTLSCVFWLTGKSGYQEFVSEKPLADPVVAYFEVKTENIGYGKITKLDEESGMALSGAKYGIYTDSACTDEADIITTGSDGTAITKALSEGTYYVKEIQAPAGYLLSDKVHTLTVKAGQTTTFTTTDKKQSGALTIYKEGEVLTGWNGSSFIYEVKKLPGAIFMVTAGEDIYEADGTLVYSKGDVVAENLVSGSDGKVVLTDLQLGTYVVTETKSIDGYTINNVPQTVTIEYKDQTVEIQYESTTIQNNRQKAEVLVVKKDSVTANLLDGGEYTLYAGNDIKNDAGQVIVAKDTALETVTTGEDGKALYTVDLPVSNSYYISETKAPAGYIRNSSDVYSFSFNYLPETKAKADFNHEFLNERTTAKIHISKVDKETGLAVPQGDASLEGAVYGLYAREDIMHPDGVTGVMFKAGDLVATMTTDANGEAEVNQLYLGNYYVKEITAPEGYLLDEEEHEVICDYEGDLVTEISRSTTLADQVMKQPFQLIKISDNGENTEASLLEKAGFTAYLKSSLSVKTDGGYDFENATPVVIGENGATQLFTDEKGHLVTIPIPYGTYVVIETVTPHNMDPIEPFEVHITENNPVEPQTWRVFIDREFTAKLRVIKKDADTGMAVLIPDTEFKIFNMDTNKYVEMITTYPSKEIHTSFFTDEDGDLILPDVLGIGNYRIEEVSAPFGYILNENYVEVKVDTDTFHEVDPDTYEAVITAEYTDVPAVGELVIEKKGEILDAYHGDLSADSEEKGFVYKESPLAGAKFEIYAAEDIYTADMQKDENGNRNRYYAEGDLVASVVTGEDGKAKVSDLPLGTYRVVEVEAPYGYVLNSEAQFVTFVYVDDKTPVVQESLTFKNERQKVQITGIKKDAETKEALEGAAFSLYVKEDIYDADGRLIVAADTFIEKVVTGTDGTAVFVSDLPFGKYYVKEIEAPAGYVKSDACFVVEASYQGSNVEVIEFEAEFENYPIKLEITKTDITGEHELKGATLSIIDINGNVIHNWVSDGTAHVIYGIPAGKYILREEIAPYGYKIANDVEFEVEETMEIQKVSMKDEFVNGKIIIEKTDEYTKKGIAGVEFEIRDKDGNVLETLVTDKDGHAESGELPIAVFEDGKFAENIKYYVVETKAADGYILDETVHEVVLEYGDETPEVVTYTLNITNKPTEPGLPQTGDNFNPWLYGVFGLSALLTGVLVLFDKKKKK